MNHHTKGASRSILLLCTAMAAFAMNGIAYCAKAITQRPNIILIISDDQGYGDLGFTGNPVAKTPHTDALAGESTLLNDYHVAPTCAPTRAALLTGHWSNKTGVWHTVMGRSLLRDNEVTLGQLLKENGYQTGMFGKWHLGDNFPYRPEDRGFDEVYRHGGGGVGQTPDVWDNSYFDGSYFHNGKVVPAKGFCTDVFFDAGNAFIRKSAAEKKPFFAYIALNAPHVPLHCPKKYMDLYPDQNPQLAAFYGMISNIDDNVGKTRALLKELGIDQNTIVMYTTDNGTASGQKVFNAGMRGSKGSKYDGGHRVPFFLHWPAGGMNKKRSIEEITHAVDIVPTLLDLTGTKKPEKLKFDGLSLRPLLAPSEETKWPDRMMITDSQRVLDPIKWRNSAVMSDRWRLIDGVELYDIQADPGQSKDVAKEHPEQTAAMRAFYETWWKEIEPTFSQTTEIYLGHPSASKVALNSHDWMGKMNVPWSQSLVRGGLGFNPKNHKAAKHESHWAVKVVKTGTYEISLSRWPEEANRPISSAHPAGADVPGAERAYRAKEGVAIPIREAVLRVDNQEIARKPVTAEDVSVSFTTQLTAGSHRLSPFFVTDQGGELGCYYAVVTLKP